MTHVPAAPYLLRPTRTGQGSSEPSQQEVLSTAPDPSQRNSLPTGSGSTLLISAVVWDSSLENGQLSSGRETFSSEENLDRTGRQSIPNQTELCLAFDAGSICHVLFSYWMKGGTFQRRFYPQILFQLSCKSNNTALWLLLLVLFSPSHFCAAITIEIDLKMT